MLNARLTWNLETKNLITNFQTGFRKRRNTTSHLVQLETYIREAFIEKIHLIGNFSELEKAYEKTQRYRIMQNLKEMGIKGRLSTFIQNLLANRSFKNTNWQYIIGNRNTRNGNPHQESIVSITLFNIKMNTIECINPGMTNFPLCTQFPDMKNIWTLYKYSYISIWTATHGL